MSNALLSIYKPVGVSSFKVLSDVKKAFGTKKVGHMGTLDPLAEGVLPVAVGKYTKLIPLIKLSPKTYWVKIFFGLSSETLDAEGVDLDNLPRVELDFTESRIRACLDGFVGEILQVPPLYSALKVDGKRLYEYAREDAASDLKIRARRVEMFSYRDLQFEGQYLSFRLECGNGFYVRSLVRDLAEKLNVPAFMFGLVREKVGPFDLDTVSYGSDYNLLDLESVFEGISVYQISKADYQKISHGHSIAVDLQDQELLILKYEDLYVALATVDENEARILRLFI